MSEVQDIGAGVQRLLTAYERLGVARRRALDLNANEETALLLVGQGVTAPSELSRTIGMTTAGVTNLLDRLEAGGHLRREPHQTDKRRVLLTLTKRGFRAQMELEATHTKVAELAPAKGTDAARELQRFLDEAAALIERKAAERPVPAP